MICKECDGLIVVPTEDELCVQCVLSAGEIGTP